MRGAVPVCTAAQVSTSAPQAPARSGRLGPGQGARAACALRCLRGNACESLPGWTEASSACWSVWAASEEGEQVEPGSDDEAVPLSGGKGLGCREWCVSLRKGPFLSPGA